ncbi:uncharacterized protein LOC133793839 [Humulus lupulus]|uniref:uncharacterized protein LOC133793839 n=1 Tax=Humulus lupulus TaxID=3486 RepID=UPI002B402FC3|nr:uncharacterized protein LOC133793839 [Humulus lupulus]
MKPIPKWQEEDEEEEEEEDHKGENNKINLAIWDCGSPLYDSYELVSLSHLIERHLMILPSPAAGSSSRRFIMTARFSHHHHRQSIHVDDPPMAKGSSMVTRLSELVERKIVWKSKVFGSSKRKENYAKKLKATTSFSKLSGFYNRIASWRR